MAAIAWWGIPIGATLVAVLWTAWAGRPRRPEDVHDTVEHYQRFREAISADLRGDRGVVRGAAPGGLRGLRRKRSA